MEYDTLIEQELHKTHQKRNRVGYFSNPASLFISIYFQRLLLELDIRWFLAAGLIIFGTVLRVVVGEVFFEQWKKKVPWARFLSVVSFLSLALGWVFHFADVHYHYGAASNNVSYTLLIIAAYVAASSTSLIADKVSYYTFVVTILLGTIVVFLTDAHWMNSFVVFNIILYAAFNIGTYNLGHNQLLELIEARIRSQSENDRLKNIINTVPGFVGLMNRDLIFYMVNQTTLNFYPHILGAKIGTIDSNSLWEKFVIDFMASEKSNDVSEQQTRVDGKDLYVLFNIQKTADGGAIIVSIITTELVEARKQLREQEAKAQYSARLASLGEMAAGIAHEVNNPLTIIQGSANILKRLLGSEPLDKETSKVMAEKIFETSGRISKTVKSLKALSRNGENDPFQDVSIPNMLKISLDVAETRFRQNDTELRLPEVIPDYTVVGREVQLSQVILNLLGNALDAVKKLDERWVEIKIQKDQNWLDILVIDAGNGIPVEIQAKIMDPFFTTKDVNEGTGLGLSISKSILNEHGGELSLLPEEPHTTFRLRLPLKK